MILLRDLEKLVWTGFALLTLCAVSVRASVVVDLAGVDQADIQVSGEIFNDESGTSVASGDINGDGKEDLIIGIPLAHWGGSDPGEVVVIWGSSAFPAPHNLDLAFATKNLLVKGKADDDRTGFAVASGDVNGDGIDDLIVGAPSADPLGRLNAGEIYVFYGSTGFGPSQIIDLAMAGVPDLTLQGVNAGDYWGKVLSTGDINGDGIDDILFSSIRADYAVASRSDCGAAMVVYGSASFLPNEIKDLASGADITVYGDTPYEYLGTSIAAGELNGLPGEELIIGGRAVDGPSGRTNSGVVYAIWGSTSFAPNHIVDNPVSQADFTLWGRRANDYLGMSVSTGDFNDDGLDDIIVGAIAADPTPLRSNAGEVYVIYGRLSFPLTWDLANSATPPDIKFLGARAEDALGQSLDATDMKNDGIQDMIIGAPLADPKGRADAGSVFVVNGSTSFPPAHVVDFSFPGQADLEVVGKQPGDMLGVSVSGGDMGGNAYGDILIGAPKSDPLGRTWAGESYVIYGKLDPTPTPTATLTASATFTQSETWTSTPTFTLTHTPAFSSTLTNTATETATFTETPTNTPTSTVTATFTETPTNTPTSTVTATFTDTQTESPSPTYSPTFTHTLTEIDTPTATPTNTATQSPTGTVSPTVTASPTLTKTLSPTISFTESPTQTWTMTFTALETDTRTATQTATPTLTPPLSFTTTPSATATITDTPTATKTHTPTATSTATFTATFTNTASPTATVLDTPTPSPTLTATLSVTPSLTPTALATSTATLTFTPTPALPETVEAWPNPFRPSDAVRGTVKIGPVSSEARVVLFTLAGERLRILRAGANSPASWEVWTLSGSQNTQATVLEWDGRTESGLDVVAGLYFYVVEEEGRSVARGKIALIR